MKKLLLAVAAGSVAVAMAQPANAQGTQGHAGMAANADANGDGVISRDEFMKFHEAMFDRMKNQDGVIVMKDMKDMPMDCPMMGGDMMKRDKRGTGPMMGSPKSSAGSAGRDMMHGR